MLEIKPPASIARAQGIRVFLAGSIEMGTVEDWQDKIASQLSSRNITIFNPRRVDWDASWLQTKESPQFLLQVNWELDALEQADVIVFYFVPGTKSPISLLELGLVSAHKKVIVCCPTGFWKKGNVDIVCMRYSIDVVETLPELMIKLHQLLDTLERS